MSQLLKFIAIISLFATFCCADNNNNIVILNDSNFKDLVMNSDDIWFINVHANCGGFCDNFASEFENVARKVRGKVKFGKILRDDKGTSQFFKDFETRSFPNYKVFPQYKQNKQTKWYDGNQNSHDELSMRKNIKYELQRFQPLQQLVNDEIFKDFCEQQGTCIISFLPHIYDTTATERNSYIQKIKNIHHSNKEKPFTFIWAQAGDQADLEKQLGLEAGYPALVAVNLRKTAFSVLKGAYNVNRINKFLNDIVAGKEQLQKFEWGNPILVTVEPWDGKDKKQDLKKEDI